MIACFVSSQSVGEFSWFRKFKVLEALVFYLTPNFIQLHLLSLPLVPFSYLLSVKFSLALHAFKPPPGISGMATHSSILAWRIPGTGEPGGLPSMGSHRVGHN